jgi:hypothetical protein
MLSLADLLADQHFGEVFLYARLELRGGRGSWLLMEVAQPP